MQNQDFHYLADAEKRSPSLFARNLRFLRKLKGISQQTLADALKLKRNQIASFESGVVEPKPEVFLAVARYFNIDADGLLTQDLSDHPSRQFPHNPAALGSPALVQALAGLVDATADLQKIYEGFVEFHDLRKSYRRIEQPDARSLSNDFENLLEIAQSTLEIHWTLIQTLQESENHQAKTP